MVDVAGEFFQKGETPSGRERCHRKLPQRPQEATSPTSKFAERQAVGRLRENVIAERSGGTGQRRRRKGTSRHGNPPRGEQRR
jgi:hypothetical protein